MENKKGIDSTAEKAVLIIEDNFLNQQLLKRMLASLATGADIAESVEAAQKRLAENRYDIVFIDVNLPDGFGDKLAVEIKKKYPATRVYILTADLLVQPNTIGGSVDGLLYKPIRLEVVQRILNEKE